MGRIPTAAGQVQKGAMIQSDIDADTPVVSPKPPELPLSEDVMKALGFRSTWPGGNPTQPWWKHDRAFLTFTDGPPTASQLMRRIYEDGVADGEERVRSAFRQLMRV